MDARLKSDFFTRDVLNVAPALLGKHICLGQPGTINRFLITETEAYSGSGDRACHASKGRTARTEIMFARGGHIYMYLIYGMYWMLNIVTGKKDDPQAVLVRGVRGFDGPGKLTRALGLDRSYYGEDLTSSRRIWIEEGEGDVGFVTRPRIGIDYAGEYWKNVPWRFCMVQ